MNVTLTTAADRDRRLTRVRRWRFGVADAALLATSCAALIVIWWSYTGRFLAFDQTERGRGGPPAINLQTVDSAAALEPALTAAFDDDADRDLAARALFDIVAAERAHGHAVPNVGALSRATVDAASIDEIRGQSVLRERLLSVRDAAAARSSVAPATIPALTASELAAVKPALVVRTRAEFRSRLVRVAVAYVLGFQLISLLWKGRGIRGDVFLLTCAHALTAVGLALLVSRPDPLRDTLLFERAFEGVLLGELLMAVVALIDISGIAAIELSFIPLAAALALSIVLIVFGTGPGSSAAKVNLGPLQPIEAIRLLLALFLAGYFARHWELLRGTRTASIRDKRLPSWVNLPRGEYALPVTIGVGASLLFFFLQKDLGPALFICCVFLAVYAVARGRTGMAIAGLLVLMLGFYAGYRLDISRTLTDRIVMWQSPWDNNASGGDQVAHAIWAMATGGWSGTGLGLGSTRYLPAGHTDLILAALGEEWGVAGWIIAAALYLAIAWRGFSIARHASSDYGFFLALTLTLFLIVPVFIMASGIIGLTPLTGVVTPFLSYGGSAMTANFVALGLLASVRSDDRARGDALPFRVPMRGLGWTMAAAAAVIGGFVVRIQTVSADALVVRPHLGVQGDGGRRFAYNPRLLDLVRDVPRGTIVDRGGLPLATDDPSVIALARPAFKALDVPLDAVCPSNGLRCYPLGGAAFHLLGDVRSRINWTAPNTSYVERDDEGALRGFDDHATTVRTSDAAGQSMTAVRRDYRELVPVLRHHYDERHPAVVAFHQRSREVRLTIDGPLQLRASTIVARYAKGASGRAAAIVIDPDSGGLLASASYPWPELNALPGLGTQRSPLDGSGVGLGASSSGKHALADPFLDRARFGLYPPGSTFKIVTAAAALRRHDGSDRTAFTCSRLPDGRVGAKIDGWSRPIRDDIQDTHPHGTIDMHEGLIHSCNAYFAQLAVALGPGALIDTANRLGISLTPAPDASSRVRDTLPQVGYGQGDVVVSPLRIVRVVAAIANGGLLPTIHWHPQDAVAAPERFLDPEAARVLGADMREVVVRGTGRSLGAHRVRIAGKTGTAEVNGKPSHSWFVGFTNGAAGHRIAFAVIVENAGYGSASAVPAAGEIVSAAVSSGLVETK